MTNITIEVNPKDAQAKLEHIQKNIQPTLLRATDRAVKYVHSIVPGYPSPPAGSTYRRTGTLGRSITTEVKHIGAEIVGSIGTDVWYAPWVISEKQVGSRGPQTQVHFRTGWYRLQDVVRKAEGDIIEIFRKAIRDLVR